MRGLTERFGNSQMMMFEEEEEKQINQALRTHSVMNTMPPQVSFRFRRGNNPYSSRSIINVDQEWRGLNELIREVDVG